MTQAISNRQILLVSRPNGMPTADNFRLVETPLAPLADGEVRVRNHYLSLDPYMRGRMSEAKSYVPAQPLGEVIVGGAAGLVVESRHPSFAIGDAVSGRLGWQSYGSAPGGELTRIDTQQAPMPAYLGVLGMPGVTAWYGLLRIIAPRAGQTVVVSAASGAVGGTVGQLARTYGCRVVGIAGGPEKCRYGVEVLGLDACLDYQAGQLEADLAEAAPAGIDGYFENVGGAVLNAVLARMNPFGRVALCGMIAGYNGTPIPLKDPALILRMRLLVQGFIVTDHMELWPAALEELGELYRTGRLRYRETVAQGLKNAPQAFIGLVQGKNFGKQLVKLV